MSDISHNKLRIRADKEFIKTAKILKENDLLSTTELYGMLRDSYRILHQSLLSHIDILSFQGSSEISSRHHQISLNSADNNIVLVWVFEIFKSGKISIIDLLIGSGSGGDGGGIPLSSLREHCRDLEIPCTFQEEDTDYELAALLVGTPSHFLTEHTAARVKLRGEVSDRTHKKNRYIYSYIAALFPENNISNSFFYSFSHIFSNHHISTNFTEGSLITNEINWINSNRQSTFSVNSYSNKTEIYYMISFLGASHDYLYSVADNINSGNIYMTYKSRSTFDIYPNKNQLHLNINRAQQTSSIADNGSKYRYFDTSHRKCCIPTELSLLEPPEMRRGWHGHTHAQ